MLLKTQRRRKVVISLTPLIDVVFILLVFFMLASSFLDWREYEVATIPANSTASASEKTDSSRILLKTNGEWLLNGTVVTSKQVLQSKLENQLSQDSNLRVTVRAESQVPVQEAMDALDILKAIGIKNVSLRPANTGTGTQR